MENKFEKFINFRIALFKFLLTFFIAGGGLLVFVSLSQLFTAKVPPQIVQVSSIIAGVVSVIFGLLFLVCLPIALIFWLTVRKGLPKMAAIEKKKAKIRFFAGLGFAVAAIIFFNLVTTLRLGAKTCNDDSCFITMANNCTAVKWQTTDKAGMEWSYYSSPYCTFEKKLLTITGNESQSMKDVLEGQSLSCDYEQKKFDAQWVNSLIFDLEPCNGELKESIARLLLLL